MPLSPEEAARQRIDEMLRQAGWVVQDHADLDLTAADGVAVREFPLKMGHGTADYLLYVRRRAVGVVEAKKVGQHLTGVEVQTERYSHGLPDLLPAVIKPLPYLYQSTGVETHFTNAMDPEPASRDVFWFHTPRTIAEDLRLGAPGALYAADVRSEYDLQSLLGRLQSMPPLDAAGMRACQAQAIRSLEESLALGRRRSLIQMQTGSGKAFMAVAQAYRLIKFGGAQRRLDAHTLACRCPSHDDHPDDAAKEGRRPHQVALVQSCMSLVADQPDRGSDRRAWAPRLPVARQRTVLYAICIHACKSRRPVSSSPVKARSTRGASKETRDMNRLVALIALALAVLGIAADAPRAEAQSVRICFVTQTRIPNMKSRYRRGEVLTVEAQVSVYALYYANGATRTIYLGPARGAAVWISEKSTRGTYCQARLTTGADGRAQIRYQVPLDPNKDNVRVCGFTAQEEPFEGTEIRIPIG